MNNDALFLRELTNYGSCGGERCISKSVTDFEILICRDKILYNKYLYKFFSNAKEIK